MKRLRYGLFALIAFTFMAFGAQAVIAAETGTTSDGFKWMYEEGTMAVVGYSGGATEITIPSVINGKKVTMIKGVGDYEKGFPYTLTNITIPKTVKTIGDRAFDCCFNLTGITIPDSVTTIGDSAFCCCKNQRCHENHKGKAR